MARSTYLSYFYLQYLHGIFCSIKHICTLFARNSGETGFGANAAGDGVFGRECWASRRTRRSTRGQLRLGCNPGKGAKGPRTQHADRLLGQSGHAQHFQEPHGGM